MPHIICGLADYSFLIISLKVQRHILSNWENDLLVNAIHIVRYMCMYIKEYIEKNPSQMHLVCEIASCTNEKCRKTEGTLQNRSAKRFKIYGLLVKGQSEWVVICSKK